MHEITVARTICTGHRIVGHKGKCRFLHGHNYEIIVTLLARELDEMGFVADFGNVKGTIDVWDHRTLLWENDPLRIENFQNMETERDFGVVRVPFNPTAENMAEHLAQVFAGIGDGAFEEITVSIKETEGTEAMFTLDTTEVAYLR